MKLVLIEWMDSTGCSTNWQELEVIGRPKPLSCRSVGWLCHEGADSVVIVPHSADVEDGKKQGCGDMTIPKCCVLRMVELAEVPSTSRPPLTFGV